MIGRFSILMGVNLERKAIKNGLSFHPYLMTRKKKEPCHNIFFGPIIYYVIVKDLPLLLDNPFLLQDLISIIP
jgi:hypothetical protein